MIERESVEKICDQIREDGAKEVDSVLEKARRTADDIVAKAESEARAAGERIIEEARERGEIAKRRTLSSVSLEVRRIKLRAREEVVTSALQRVNAAIENVRSRADYGAVLAALVVEAIGGLDGESFVVYADRRDLPLLESQVIQRVREALKAERRAVRSIEAKPLPSATLGGAQVAVPGGNVIFDNTFEARLYRSRDDIRALVFEEVFSGEEKVE